MQSNNREAIRSYFTKFNASIRSFWEDYSDRCFSLVLQPFLDSDHSMGGVAFANGFIGKYHADTILNAQRMFTISHEVGHHWVGHRLEMDITHQWFGEGFNDYVTLATLLSAKLMSAAEWEERMNEIFKSHYSSSVRNTPNDSVFANYWKMGDYNKLPYRRGCIFAFYLDNQIRLLSKGEKNIRDLLRSLLEYRKTKPAKYELTVEDFTRHASAFLSNAQVTAMLEEYIMKGNPIAFAPEMLLPVFTVQYENGIPRIAVIDKTGFQTFFDHANKKQ